VHGAYRLSVRGPCVSRRQRIASALQSYRSNVLCESGLYGFLRVSVSSPGYIASEVDWKRRGLILGTITAFSWSYWGNSLIFQDGRRPDRDSNRHLENKSKKRYCLRQLNPSKLVFVLLRNPLNILSKRDRVTVIESDKCIWKFHWTVSYKPYSIWSSQVSIITLQIVDVRMYITTSRTCKMLI
jgi:hypothetical protein